jgi:hypothetical protein
VIYNRFSEKHFDKVSKVVNTYNIPGAYSSILSRVYFIKPSNYSAMYIFNDYWGQKSLHIPFVEEGVRIVFINDKKELPWYLRMFEV